MLCSLFTFFMCELTLSNFVNFCNLIILIFFFNFAPFSIFYFFLELNLMKMFLIHSRLCTWNDDSTATLAYVLWRFDTRKRASRPCLLWWKRRSQIAPIGGQRLDERGRLVSWLLMVRARGWWWLLFEDNSSHRIGGPMGQKGWRVRGSPVGYSNWAEGSGTRI